MPIKASVYSSEKSADWKQPPISLSLRNLSNSGLWEHSVIWVKHIRVTLHSLMIKILITQFPQTTTGTLFVVKLNAKHEQSPQNVVNMARGNSRSIFGNWVTETWHTLKYFNCDCSHCMKTCATTFHSLWHDFSAITSRWELCHIMRTQDFLVIKGYLED